MPGLVPGIHAKTKESVDGRDTAFGRPGHDAVCGVTRTNNTHLSYSANSSSSAISSEKMPSASVTANPKIRLPN